jgi:hypothetical protein
MTGIAADGCAAGVGVPQVVQKRAFGASCAPQFAHCTLVNSSESK